MKPLISKYLSVNTYDLLKAGLVSCIYALLDGVVTYYFANQNTLPNATQFKAMLLQSGVVFIAYVKVKLFTNSNGKLFQSEPGKTTPSDNQNQ